METKELTDRQKAILNVPPIIWDSAMGSLIFQIEVVQNMLLTNRPEAAKKILESLAKQLEGFRHFLVTGKDL